MEQTLAGTRTILVIDHDHETRTLLCRWLEDLGLKCEGENNGHSGLSRLTLQKQRGQINGIVLNLHLPFFDGIAVLKELQERHQALPVIVTVEETHLDEGRTAVRMGARHFVLKPVDCRDFQRKCTAAFFSKGPPESPALR